MEKTVSKILKSEITTTVFYLLVGLCLVVVPVQTTNVICKIIFGLILIGAGVYRVVAYIMERETITVADLFSGVIILVMGTFLFTNPQIVVKLLPRMLGALMIVDGAWRIKGAMRMNERDMQFWKALMIISIILMILGIVILVNPFSKVRTGLLFTGISYLVNGVFDIFALLLLKDLPKEVQAYGTGKTPVNRAAAPVNKKEHHSFKGYNPDTSDDAYQGNAAAQNTAYNNQGPQNAGVSPDDPAAKSAGADDGTFFEHNEGQNWKG